MVFTVRTHEVVALFLVVCISLQPSALSTTPQVPCFFIFGDSIVDNGNNNRLKTTTKVNYPPYGIDFPDGPTGRFTNGPNQADFLAELLGFKSAIPPFATAKGREIIKGVNYASGSAGIRNETGKQLGQRISMNEQLLHHNVTVSRIARLLGNTPSRKDHLCKCLYYMVVGSNDYINNYFKPEYYSTGKKYSTKEYAAVLTREYSKQLKKLYNLGARKVAVTGLSGIGCTPGELARGTNGSLCVDAINNAVVLFNDKLQALIKSLNNHLPDAQFIYVPALELSEHIPVPGIKFLLKPCCEVSKTTGLCVRGKDPCPDRALHLFFDNFHPTSAAYKAAAAAAYAEILRLIQ
ncbi:UNVERIFIED_CONTAM: GDSL esterase/lipase [Sesamum angustifolium]|uniref:GDSL esterase/lipase n=1 Tax=Sesamum angustifolium TaxID=2727405 RepID=A0AAW2MMR8_9LAMI